MYDRQKQYVTFSFIISLGHQKSPCIGINPITGGSNYDVIILVKENALTNEAYHTGYYNKENEVTSYTLHNRARKNAVTQLFCFAFVYFVGTKICFQSRRNSAYANGNTLGGEHFANAGTTGVGSCQPQG